MTETRVKISNLVSSPTVLYWEPWGEEFGLETGRSLEVIVDAPTSPVLEVEIREDGYVFIVHDPAGA